MKPLQNQSGYLTIESAFIVPSLLVLVCLFVGFFCICFKLGAFQALVNHERLVAETQGTRTYAITQMTDTRTTLVKNEQSAKQVDDLKRIRQNFEVSMTAPFYRGQVVAEAETDRWDLPFVYQLCLAKRMGGGLEQLREKIGGKP